MSVRLPFNVEVEGIGTFTFRHSAVVDQLAIEARARDILRVPCSDEALTGWATMYARLEILTERSPEGWDLAGMDTADDDTLASILLVHGRLREEQARFREAAAARRLPAGQGGKPDDRVPVPPPVQPAAD